METYVVLMFYFKFKATLTLHACACILFYPKVVIRSESKNVQTQPSSQRRDGEQFGNCAD